MQELAELLGEKVEIICKAISTLNRLGFVEKINDTEDEELLLDFNSEKNSTSSKIDEKHDLLAVDGDDKKLGLIYDSRWAFAINKKIEMLQKLKPKYHSKTVLNQKFSRLLHQKH